MANQATVDVVILDADADERRLLGKLLAQAGVAHAEVGCVAEGRNLIRRHQPKVVLCEYELPDGRADELCAWLRQDHQLAGTYCVVISASADCLPTRELLDRGADDFVSKLSGRQEVIARVRTGMRIRAMHERLLRASITDGLTGLFNHDHFNRLLESEVSRSRRFGHPLALIMIDLDYFKAINDNFGHLAGNTTLGAVAGVLRKCVRDVDTLARFGGEEFAVIVPEATCSDAVSVAERIRSTLAQGVCVDALHGHAVTASFGLADSDDSRVNSAADLISLADRALYVAKRRGRDQVVTALELNDGTEITAQLEVDEVDRLRRQVAALSIKTRDVYVQSVAALLQALDEKDPYTARHAVNVAHYGGRIAEQLGCSRGLVKAVQNAGLLHDIGKIGIPGRILMKRSPLTSLERRVIEQVPLIGTRIVDHLRILEAEVQIIRHQREYYDGSGLPNGLKGSHIPIGARILLVADAFDAMTTDRIYRARKPIEDALSEMQSLAGAQFDPRAVTALKQLVHGERKDFDQRIDDTVAALRTGTDFPSDPHAGTPDGVGKEAPSEAAAGAATTLHRP